MRTLLHRRYTIAATVWHRCCFKEPIRNNCKILSMLDTIWFYFISFRRGAIQWQPGQNANHTKCHHLTTVRRQSNETLCSILFGLFIHTATLIAPKTCLLRCRVVFVSFLDFDILFRILTAAKNQLNIFGMLFPFFGMFTFSQSNAHLRPSQIQSLQDLWHSSSLWSSGAIQ